MPDKTHWSLPFRVEPANPDQARRIRVLRVVAWFVLAGALITPFIQFMVGTLENRAAGIRSRDKFAAIRADAALTQATALLSGHPLAIDPDAFAAKLIRELVPKSHKGAIGRWRRHVHALWDGENIYRTPRQVHAQRTAPSDPAGHGPIVLHPNMPFTVILLTPFAMLPVWAMAATFTALKIAVFLVVVWMIAELAGHHQRKIPDWVLGLGVAWALPFVIGDIQHGNTNVFVLAFVVLHLWAYRCGRDWLAGLGLAVGICLKMTPALFLLYWLYRRNWKILGTTAVAGLVLAVLLPMALLGPAHYVELTGTWLENLIIPGLVKGAWYPIHINQSLPGVASRYFIGPPHPSGNILWNPDDDPYYTINQAEYITVVALDPAMVKWIVRVGQVAIVAAICWAIGWRKLDRTDGRRSLEYGLVAAGMMLLNQRTWDHHAGVMLIAAVPVWQAIAYGRMGRRRRIVALVCVLLAGGLVWTGGTFLFRVYGVLAGLPTSRAKHLADVSDAYGPIFFYFLLMLIASVLTRRALGKRQAPYAPVRQTLGREFQPDRSGEAGRG